MLQPKRVKRRRVHRGRMTGRATRGNIISRGEFALVAQAPHWITANQIEAARVAIRNSLKRQGKLWINIFPHKPVTARPAETRMGAGKGAPEYWVAVVKPDRIMFELGEVTEEEARKAFRLAAAKLPIKTKVVTKEEQEGGGVNESK
ncbi:MAG: 50S ribosomal protein L16 [Bacillota bacterium]|nr:50S ribosomal protein L16 [Bacillota bacterium]